MKKKKSKVKIFVGIILAVVIILGVLFGAACAILGTDIVFAGVKNLVASPVNNIKAAWLFITNDSQKIEEQLGETQKEFDDAVKDATGTELSDEVKEALNSGKYTEEEMALIVSGVSIEEIEKMREEANKSETGTEKEPETENTEETVTPPETEDETEEPEKETPEVIPPEPSKDTEPQKPVEPVVPTVPDIPTTPDPVIPPATEPQNPVQADDTAATIAKMYIIKNKFMKKLESIEIDIINEYEALPKEQRVPQSRKSIAGKYISTVADMEIQCDAEVEAVLTELKEKLTALNKDLSVIETIRKAYQNEKSLKKAYYMDIYLNGVHGKDIPVLTHPDVVNN